MSEVRLSRGDGYWIGRFQAMAGPCELLMEVDDTSTANHLLDLARKEARRIEHKYSRYRDDNIVHRINHAGGEPVAVDDETADLLDYSDTCYSLSGGLFDITSGVLRRVWRFDGGDQVPPPDAVAKVAQHVGWDKVQWQRPVIRLRPEMEIDLGGIGKEYAVDRVAKLIMAETSASCLINFGGDLCVTAPRRVGRPWIVGVDDPACTGTDHVGTVPLYRGALATSGDARRFLLKDGVRYGHILNPRTGWPVEGAPRSTTVMARTCTEAGILATLAMLQGKGARSYLKKEGVQFWCA